MRLRRRLLRLEKALPRPAPPSPRAEVDWPAVARALLAGAGEGDLGGPSRRALADLTPYAGVVRAFLEEAPGPAGGRS